MTPRTPLVTLAMLALVGCKTPEPAPSPEAPPKKAAQKNEPSPDKKAAGADKVAAPNAIPTKMGDVVVTPLEHGSMRLTWQGKQIYIDPTSSALAKSDTHPPADLVVVTHIHGDHLDPAAIAKVRTPNAPVVVPKAVADKAGDALPEPTLLANGESRAFLDDKVNVKAVEMYNLKRKRDSGEFFHPKGVGNGYVLEMGGARIYISGDTECTPEMKALKDIDAAFVCMNLPYTMTVEEAAGCIGAFKPKIAFPYHHRDQDPSKIPALLGADSPVDVRILDWYPKASP